MIIGLNLTLLLSALLCSANRHNELKKCSPFFTRLRTCALHLFNQHSPDLRSSAFHNLESFRVQAEVLILLSGEGRGGEEEGEQRHGRGGDRGEAGGGGRVCHCLSAFDDAVSPI